MDKKMKLWLATLGIFGLGLLLNSAALAMIGAVIPAYFSFIGAFREGKRRKRPSAFVFGWIVLLIGGIIGEVPFNYICMLMLLWFSYGGIRR